MWPPSRAEIIPSGPAARPAPRRSRGVARPPAASPATRAATPQSQPLDLHGDGPAPLAGRHIPLGAGLQRNGLLVVRQETGVEAGAHCFCRFKPSPKTLPDIDLESERSWPISKGCIGRPNLWFPARWLRHTSGSRTYPESTQHRKASHRAIKPHISTSTANFRFQSP